MKNKYLLLVILTFLYSALITLSLFIEGIVYFEWIISLLPYWLSFNVLILLVLLIKKPLPKALFLIILLPTLFLLLRFVNFTEVEPHQTTTAQTPVKIAFLNKYYRNTNYQEINTKVEKINPDILSMAEFSEADKKNLTFMKQYPCVQYKYIRKNMNIAFFSKYPCLVDESNTKFRYTLPIKIQIGGKNYTVFVTHTLSPVDPVWLIGRDEEMDRLADYLSNLSDENIIVLGDFNTTPWSPVFVKFQSRLTKLKNAASGKGIFFTWNSSFVDVQIDHIFLPNRSLIENFRTEEIEGSDHNLIWAQVKI